MGDRMNGKVVLVSGAGGGMGHAEQWPRDDRGERGRRGLGLEVTQHHEAAEAVPEQHLGRGGAPPDHAPERLQVAQ